MASVGEVIAAIDDALGNAERARPELVALKQNQQAVVKLCVAFELPGVEAFLAAVQACRESADVRLSRAGGYFSLARETLSQAADGANDWNGAQSVAYISDAFEWTGGDHKDKVEGYHQTAEGHLQRIMGLGQQIMKEVEAVAGLYATASSRVEGCVEVFAERAVDHAIDYRNTLATSSSSQS